jgi:hypothetical protein
MGNVVFKFKKIFSCCGGDDVRIRISCCGKCFDCELDKKADNTEDKDVECSFENSCFKFRRNQISPSNHEIKKNV